jgi:hypothetical protein
VWKEGILPLLLLLLLLLLMLQFAHIRLKMTP